MRTKVLTLIILGGAAIGLLLPTFGLGQQKGPGGIGGPPGGGPGGKMSKMMSNPDAYFDRYANGKEFVMISDFKILKDPAQQWATENAITNGQLTRAQFHTFSKWYQDKLASGEIVPQFGKGGQGGGQKAGWDPDQMAAMTFKQIDKNGDGFLTEDEMPDKLKAVWRDFDKDRDGKISLDEFKAYFRTVSQQLSGGGDQGGMAPAVMIEEEWEKRPVVFRAGNLPKELMPGGPDAWFYELDTDKDGQVGYYEWRKSGKSFEDFSKYDRNGDGLLTPEEVLWYQKVNGPKNADGTFIAETNVVQGPTPGFNAQPRFGNNNGPPNWGNKGGGGSPGKGNFGKGGPGKGGPGKGGGGKGGG